MVFFSVGASEKEGQVGFFFYNVNHYDEIQPSVKWGNYMGPNDDIWFLKKVTFIFVSLRTVDDYKI